MRELNRKDMQELQERIDALRGVGEDYIILSVGVRGPNLDCPDGNAVATVRMGNDEATCEAAWLYAAVTLARSKIIRERAAKAELAKKEKENANVK